MGPRPKTLPLPTDKRRSNRIPIALFLLLFLAWCIWLLLRSSTPHLPLAGEPPQFYSNHSQPGLRATLVHAIQKAERSIHLVMFGLSDPAILHALGQAEVKTTVHFDPTGTPHLWHALPKATLHPTHGKKGLMHQKICILDQETVFLGSANMTTPSLLMHDNLVIGFKDKGVAQFLTQNTPHTTAHYRTSVGGQDVEIWLLPDPQGDALHQLKKAIRQARRSLRIALFTFTYPPLLEEVIEAHKRGVEVTVLLDFHSALGASRNAVEQLKQAGVPLLVSKGLQLLHHKFIWLDGETLFTGSANWTKAAFYRNQDCSIALHHLTEEQHHFLRKLWRRMESEGKRL